MELTLIIKRREFTNGQGELVSYISCIADLNGVEIHFVPKDTDKKLFSYLITELLDGGK